MRDEPVNAAAPGPGQGVPAAGVAPAVAPEGVRCIRCGYGLAGLATSGVCPECTLPIARALSSNALRNCEPAYIRRMVTGAVLVEASFVLAIVAVLVAVLLVIAGILISALGAQPQGAPAWLMRLEQSIDGEVVIELVGFGASIVSLAGWWLLSEPDPASAERDATSRLRLPVRILTVVQLIFAAAPLALLASPPLRTWWEGLITPNPQPVTARGALGLTASLDSIMSWSGHLFTAACGCVQLLYLRDVARRVPDDALAREANKNAWWYLGLSSIGTMCLFIGPLIAFFMAYRMIRRTRRALRGVLHDMESGEERGGAMIQ